MPAGSMMAMWAAFSCQPLPGSMRCGGGREARRRKRGRGPWDSCGYVAMQTSGDKGGALLCRGARVVTTDGWRGRGSAEAVGRRPVATDAALAKG